MSMEPSSVELKIISCKGLKNFNFFQKLTIYTLVYIHSNDPEKKLDEKQVQEQRTLTDKEGNENPEWNQEVKFRLSWVSLQDCDHLFLHFDFRHDGLLLGDKLIGEVRVPLKDLILESSRALGVVRFVNYEVRNSEGKPNGIFNFSYRIICNKGVLETHYWPENLEGKINGYPLLHPDLTDPNLPNNSRIQTSNSEIQSVPSGDTVSYPIVTDPTADGLNSPSAPPHASSPSVPDYHHHYSPISPHYPPPPAGLFMPPVPPHPFPMHYPHPPPPPPPHLGAYRPPFYAPLRPEAHGWGASNPNFQHPWSPRW